MLYIYDILLNFMDGDVMYEFFEWEYKDMVEHIKQIPAIKVNDKVFNDFIYSEVIVDSEFLDLIKNKAATYKEKIEYACLIVNDERCFAVEFNKAGNIIFRSSLLIDEEEDVVSCCNRLPNSIVDYKVVKTSSNINRILTRKEERDANLIKREIISAYEYKEYEKLNYLYNEAYKDDSLDIDERYKRLIEDIENNFSANLKSLVKIISLANKK